MTFFKSNDSNRISDRAQRTDNEGAGPLANERRRRNFSRFALRHARSHLGPGPALPKLALDHSSPPQNGRPWTTLGDIGPTLDRVVQGWTNAEIAALRADVVVARGGRRIVCQAVLSCLVGRWRIREPQGWKVPAGEVPAGEVLSALSGRHAFQG